MLPWRVCYQSFQLHCTWGKTLLQTPPYPTDQGEGQLKPAWRWPWEECNARENQWRRSRSRDVKCLEKESWGPRMIPYSSSMFSATYVSAISHALPVESGKLFTRDIYCIAIFLSWSVWIFICFFPFACLRTLKWHDKCVDSEWVIHSTAFFFSINFHSLILKGNSQCTKRKNWYNKIWWDAN